MSFEMLSFSGHYMTWVLFAKHSVHRLWPADWTGMWDEKRPLLLGAVSFHSEDFTASCKNT
jgi:hypothetical protein